MTRRAWIVLAIAIFACLIFTTCAGIGGWMLIKHYKPSAVQSDTNGLALNTTKQDTQTWRIDTAFDSSSGKTYKWISVFESNEEYDITIFDSGNMQLTALGDASLLICPDGSDGCGVSVAFDSGPMEIWHVENDEEGRRLKFTASKELIKSLVKAKTMSITFTTPNGPKTRTFNVQNCPISAYMN